MSSSCGVPSEKGKVEVVALSIVDMYKRRVKCVCSHHRRAVADDRWMMMAVWWWLKEGLSGGESDLLTE